MTVSKTGNIKAACSLKTGVATVLVHMRGQNVTSTVTVEVVAARHLMLAARPWPSYPKSTTVEVSQLLKIQCSSPLRYQQAVLESWLVLTNNATTAAIPSDLVSFELLPEGSAAVLRRDGAVLTGLSSGAATIRATFNGLQSTELRIDISDTAVNVTSIDGLQLRAGGRQLLPLQAQLESIQGSFLLGLLSQMAAN